MSGIGGHVRRNAHRQQGLVAGVFSAPADNVGVVFHGLADHFIRHLEQRSDFHLGMEREPPAPSSHPPAGHI